MEYCSHVWGAAPPSTLSILDSIERKAIRLIDDPVLTERLSSLAHRRDVCDLSPFYRYFHRLCSEELTSIIPPLAVRSRVTRGAFHMHPYTVQLQKPTEHPITCAPSYLGCPDYGTPCLRMYFHQNGRPAHCAQEVRESGLIMNSQTDVLGETVHFCGLQGVSRFQIFPPLVLGRISFYYSPIGCS